MRRRFTLAIVGVAAGAILIAGLGTLILLNLQAHRQARKEVTELANNIAASYLRTPRADPNPVGLQQLLRSTQQLTLVRVTAAGLVGTIPGQVTATDLHADALRRGATVTGFHGSTAFAAAPFTYKAQLLAAVVTQHSAGSGGPLLYFILADAVIIVVAFGVAETLARRITRPLVLVEQAAGRIAEGDLSARVAAGQGSYPEVASLGASINAMANNLERLRGQERQFLLSVSHDLRTPLTSIRGFAEAMSDGTTSDTRRAAEIIAAEARRLERLVRDLLDLAKLEARAFSFDLRPTDLWEVVADTAHGFRPTAEGLGLTVVVHEPVVEGANPAPLVGGTNPAPLVGGTNPAPLVGGGDLAPLVEGTNPALLVAADADRLAQVVANLVENACKYATETIEVGTWYRTGETGIEGLITVDDDGPGIPTEDLPHVFERLWTSNRVQARPVGSGLGLAIVAELVAAMGGTIRAESPVPRWTPAGGQPGTRLIVALRAMAPGQAAPSATRSMRGASRSVTG